MASSSTALLTDIRASELAAPAGVRSARPLDWTMLAGIAIAFAATVAGVAATGVSLAYFVQPAAALIVLGGTLGVTLITAPRDSLLHSLRRVAGLLHPPSVDREALISEIVSHARRARAKGILGIAPAVDKIHHPFLREALSLAMDVRNRQELQTTLELKVRLRERQGETDAKALETAGGFAPTIGVVGTVVGLIDVLRQFSSLASVTSGIGTAFVSTIYGLVLANLVLLPAASRIRASVAETFEVEELVTEGVLCLLDGMHPALLRERLSGFLRETANG